MNESGGIVGSPGQNGWQAAVASVLLWNAGAAVAEDLKPRSVRIEQIAAADAGERQPHVLPQRSDSALGVDADNQIRTPPWTLTISGANDFTITDNVLLSATNRKADFLTSPSVDVEIGGLTPRIALVADLNLTYDIYAHNPSLNGARPKAMADALVDIVEDTFSVDGRVVSDLQQLSPEGQVPATERTFSTNQTQVLNYSISPTLNQRLSEGINAEVIYNLAGVSYLDIPAGSSRAAASNLVRQTGTVTLSNGNDFNRLGWTLFANYERNGYSRTALSSDRSSVEADLRFQLSNEISLLGKGGQENFDEPTLTANLDGAYALGGFLWRPSQSTSVRFEAGYRYRGFNAESELSYRLGNGIVIAGSYMRDIQSAQRLLADSLAALRRDDFGNLVDPVTGLPPNPNYMPFDPTNQAFKRDIYRVGIYGDLVPIFFNVSGNYERRVADANHGDSRGARVEIGREITRTLRAKVVGEIAETKGLIAGSVGLDSKSVVANARLDYQVNKSFRTALKYFHVWRKTTLLAYSENVGVLSFAKVF